MGKSSGSYDSPPVIMPQPQQDNTAMLALIDAIKNQAPTEIVLPSTPEIPLAPTYIPPPTIAPMEWPQVQASIAQAAREDFNREQKKKRGRTSTILTSPLLDEEDPAITQQTLG